MRKKDILELKKRLKKNHCTFTKMCGCYVTGEKHVLLKFRETFLNLEEEEYYKYLEIAKKILSGTLGNNILKLDFPLNENLENDRQLSLMQLKSSALKSDELLDAFYELVINNYNYAENYLILIFHDAYDVITKTSDNAKLDESEEVYEYVLCAICPVTLSDPGLRYFEEQNSIKARIRDWVVEAPSNGFVFPAFIERGADVNSVMYYTKNPKDTHPELMENVLGCPPKQTTSVQKETFQSIIKDSFIDDEKKADKIFMEVQDNLNSMLEEHNAMYEDTECEPITLTNKAIKTLLIDSGVPEELTAKIEKNYNENFGADLPLAENLIDSKILKANEQKKTEARLQKQVEILENRLEEVKNEASAKEAPEITSDALSNDLNYDVILQVKPEKISQIKSQFIDGQKCIIIPIDENEQATVNGLNNLI